MKPKQWMDRTWDEFSDQVVKVVHCPVPPSPVKNIIFMPSSWNTKFLNGSYDRRVKCVASTLTRMGPTILIYIRLSEFLNYDREGLLKLTISTCCAGVSFRELLRSDNGLVYADDVVLDSLQTVSRSCHPGSHYVVPHAPYLSALLQCEHARGHSGDVSIDYLRPDEAVDVFPTCKFETNAVIDRYISKCCVDDNVSFYGVNFGLGEWSVEFLRKMRINKFLMKGQDYAEWGFDAEDESACCKSEEDVWSIGGHP